MQERCNNRLTVIGPKEQVQRFLGSKWEKRLQGRYFEWMENFPRRVVCLFETDEPPTKSLTKLSRRRPGIIFLLEYEIECERIKGLAKVQDGQLQHFEVSY